MIIHFEEMDVEVTNLALESGKLFLVLLMIQWRGMVQL